MIRRQPLKAVFYLNVLIVTLLIGYKAYLNFFEPSFKAIHTEQVERIHNLLAERDTFSFAVVGNINNSVGIFERKIIPMINNAGVDFVVSAGNAVSSGSEDKYRAAQGTLSYLNMPYLLTFGQHEYESFGSFRFYEHFGPHFFNVRAGNSRFIFLDSTGKTPWRWQTRWLRDILSQNSTDHTFLFVGHPLMRSGEDVLFDEDEDYLHPNEFRDELIAIIREYNIDAVFSANISQYDSQQHYGTEFIISGGAGGLMLNNDVSFHHFVKVSVNADSVATELVPLEISQQPVFKHLESLWFFVYSLFYVGYVNFILIISALTLIAIKLYAIVFVGKDYYPDYDLDPTPWLDKPLRVAMFTNNYLPFIGGVPISIARLRRGLQTSGNPTLVVAPRYKDQPEKEDHVLRVPSLLAMGEKREFRLANIFLGRIRKRVKAFKPDIIHLHHPFWLGSLGLFVARRLRIPAIYTYHTRLEHYAHFVPLPGTLFRNLISHALIKRFANKCDAVIVPTYSTEEYLRMIGVKSPTYVQPTGIEYERFQSVTDEQVNALRSQLGLGDERIFISVSRLSNEKNIDFMFDAIASLKTRTQKPFRFLMIGDGHQRDRLQKRVENLNLQDVITLVGAVPPDDMATYYQLGDLFLFASKSETQGMVILEAMAAGLPVVAVRSSGIDDVVRHGFNGYKTPENRDQWRDRIASLLEDDDLRKTLSDNALAFAKDYSIEQFAQDVKVIYGTILAAKVKRQGPASGSKSEPLATD
ncbi:MAG: glycosyltransferase [Marinobacter sp.]|uniref:glycosyltransferase n=1 Tax=Marinobacter sp. TaxID=50741 RepID=UPI0034A01F76